MAGLPETFCVPVPTAPSNVSDALHTLNLEGLPPKIAIASPQPQPSRSAFRAQSSAMCQLRSSTAYP